MHSIVFIKAAGELIPRIEEVGPGNELVQKEITHLFSSLFASHGNPTLPSASRLRDVALANGYIVSGMVRERLAYGESLFGN